MTTKTKVCPKCGAEHHKAGTFCTRKCANARVFTAEANEKRSVAARARFATLKQDDPEACKAYTQPAVAAYVSKMTNALMEADTATLSASRLRRRIYIEQKGCCLHCGLSEWMGQKLTIEVDHIDGDNTNGQRENLRGLCPNCHSLTPTWKTGNKPHWKKRK